MINYLSVGRSPFVQEVPFYIRKKKVSYSHRKFKEMRDLNVPVAEVAQTP
jgi:hypothetical protein